MSRIFFNANQNVRLIWRFLLFIIVVFLLNIPLQLGLQEILAEGLLRGYVSASIFFISILFSLYVQVKFLDKSSFKKYGLHLSGKWAHEFIVGCIIAAVQLAVFFVIMYLTGNLKIVGFFITETSDFTFIEGFMSEMFGQLVGSTGEEIFFRSFLFYIIFEALRSVSKEPVKRAVIACLITSPLFGLAHWSNEGATFFSTVNLGLDAMMISLPFLITGRLGMSIGLHFSWNILQGAVFGFANSGHIAKASVMSVSMPDNILTGGSFGPEGSALILLLDIMAVLLIVWWKNSKKYDAWVSPDIIEVHSMRLVNGR